MKPYYDKDGITIYHGDAREVLPCLELVRGRLVTDPPYGIDSGSGTLGKRGRAARVTWPDTLEHVREVYVPACVLALGLCGGVGVITPGSPNCFEYPKPDDIGFIYQPCATGVGRWGRATCQPVLFYGKDPRAGKHLDPVTITINQPSPKCGHPTPKPMKVAAWMVSRVALPGDTVIDPFCGSGTTLRAAKDAGIKAVGIEIDERYCEIAAKRLAQDVLQFSE